MSPQRHGPPFRHCAKCSLDMACQQSWFQTTGHLSCLRNSQHFMKQNGIRYIWSPHFHPATNGLSVRAVRSVKSGMKKSVLPLQHKLATWLLHYRTTPHTTTGRPPCKLLMHRTLRTRLTLLHPSPAEMVSQWQDAQKLGCDKCTHYAYSQWEIQSWCMITELKSQSRARVSLHRF